MALWGVVEGTEVPVLQTPRAQIFHTFQFSPAKQILLMLFVCQLHDCILFVGDVKHSFAKYLSLTVIVVMLWLFLFL